MADHAEGMDARVFPLSEDWQAPARSEWRHGFGARSLDVAALDAEGIDIRDRVWWLLRLAGADERDREEMMRPFLNGYWRVSDGMSSPVWRGTLHWAGMPKHPLFVAHDLDYYLGTKPRLRADGDMRRRMELFGWPWRRRALVYRAVRWFGMVAWRRHARLRMAVPGYGTEDFISHLAAGGGDAEAG